MRHFEWPAPRLALIVVAAVLGACGDQGPLDEAALARQLRALGSLSAEAAFTAQQLREGHLRASLAAVHLKDLADDTERARGAIARPAIEQLEARRVAAQERAQELAQALHDIESGQARPDDPLIEQGRRNAQRLKREFDALEKRA